MPVFDIHSLSPVVRDDEVVDKLPGIKVVQIQPMKRISQVPIVVPKSEGFFHRHWKAILATAGGFAAVGLGVGLALGVTGAVGTFGLGVLLLPVFAVAGFASGAAVGFAVGCLGSCLVDSCGCDAADIPIEKSVSSVSQASTHKSLGEVVGYRNEPGAGVKVHRQVAAGDHRRPLALAGELKDNRHNHGDREEDCAQKFVRRC
jgi:hypothetical protein